MNDILLLKSQTNAVFHTIQSTDLRPSDFIWTKVVGTNGEMVSKLIHRETGYYFVFDFFDDSDKRTYLAVYKPSEDGTREVYTKEGSWDKQLTLS